MKKIIFVLSIITLVVCVSPAVSEASWWNPISWFRKSAPVSTKVVNYQDTKVKEVKEKIKELAGNESTVTAKLGETLNLFGVNATVAEVVEDSRCPSGAQCIQAGTVRVKINAKYGLLSKSVVLSLNEPFTFRGYTATLTSVTPEQVTDQTINLSDYTFTFVFSKPINDKKYEDKKEESKVSRSSVVAKCLKDSGAIFYGAFWCPHCKSQKALFGDSVKILPYVECSTPDANGQTEICKQNKIEGYPTWKFKDGSVLTGEVAIEDLAKKAGCAVQIK